jgi:CubicO group peptidase (beta-lactamase class C family)
MKMIRIKSSYVLLLFLFLLGGCKNEKVITPSLQRSTPEKEGVSSQGIIDFLNAVSKSKNELHSLVFLRHGKVIAEGWWNPYKPEMHHTLYSLSKSFTATAVGFAVTEKRMSINDKVDTFFPDEITDTVSNFLAGMTVKDLLSMSAGMDPDPTFKIVVNDSNWVRSFLKVPVVNKPGIKFLYNTLATYMLSAIVQKVTGEKVIDYLKPRLFEPLAIEGMDWEVDPQGINCGGWGLRLKTEDMAKFGQLFLQKGKWNGKQLLPASWIEEASTKKIDQAPDARQSQRDSSDWMQGYCYQMWRCRHNAFRGDGAYGQYIIVMPDQDAVIAITSETPDMQDELNLVWDYLLPSIKDKKLPEDAALSSALKHKLASLALPLDAVGNNPEMIARISGKPISLEPNDKLIKTVNILFTDSICKLSMEIGQDNYNFSLGFGKWMPCETTLHGPNLLLQAKAHYVGLPPAKVAGSFGWKDETTLELVLRYVESPHTETMTFKFDKNKVLVGFHYSNMPRYNPPEIKGTIKE